MISSYCRVLLLGMATSLAGLPSALASEKAAAPQAQPASLSSVGVVASAGMVAPSNAVITITVENSAGVKVSSAADSAESADAGTLARMEIKHIPFEKRAECLALIARLEDSLDQQIYAQFNRRNSTGSDPATWDFAMKEMRSARIFLESTSAELTKATSATWDQQKATVGRAWDRTQDAYGRVKTAAIP
jgi:hypothetical protein